MWIMFLIIFDSSGSSGRMHLTMTTAEFTSQDSCVNAVKQSASRNKKSFYDAWCSKK
jgi:hypothetical protein